MFSPASRIASHSLLLYCLSAVVAGCKPTIDKCLVPLWQAQRTTFCTDRCRIRLKVTLAFSVAAVQQNLAGRAAIGLVARVKDVQMACRQSGTLHLRGPQEVRSSMSPVALSSGFLLSVHLWKSQVRIGTVSVHAVKLQRAAKVLQIASARAPSQAEQSHTSAYTLAMPRPMPCWRRLPGSPSLVLLSGEVCSSTVPPKRPAFRKIGNLDKCRECEKCSWEVRSDGVEFGTMSSL